MQFAGMVEAVEAYRIKGFRTLKCLPGKRIMSDSNKQLIKLESTGLGVIATTASSNDLEDFT